MSIYSVFDDIAFLEREFPELLPDSMKRTRWYKCRLCSDQFTTRRLLEIHKKYAQKYGQCIYGGEK